MSRNLVILEITRARIKALDTSPITSYFMPYHLLRASEFEGGVIFTVGGYDEDPRELHHIPEVRDYFADLRRVWPYLIYFGNRNTDALWIPYLCVLGDTQSLSRDAGVNVSYHRAELIRLLRADLSDTLLQARRVGRTGAQRCTMLTEIAAYFRVDWRELL